MSHLKTVESVYVLFSRCIDLELGSSMIEQRKEN